MMLQILLDSAKFLDQAPRSPDTVRRSNRTVSFADSSLGALCNSTTVAWRLAAFKREGRRRAGPKASVGRSAATQMPGHHGPARPALPRRGLHIGPDGPTCAVHRRRAGSRCRSVHAAPLRCTCREGTPADLGTHQNSARRAQSAGGQSIRSVTPRASGPRQPAHDRHI